MKLRNRKTGEIGLLHCDMQVKPMKIGVFEDTDIRGHYWEYSSLAELNEEWEDYEEDELFYVISAEDEYGYQCVLKETYPEICKVAKELGIGFETEKECRKAVEKLKAWTRLKDNGFKFHGWENGKTEYPDCVLFSGDSYHGDEKDLDLLFGGENE